MWYSDNIVQTKVNRDQRQNRINLHTEINDTSEMESKVSRKI
jgi:hypothetical protein